LARTYRLAEAVFFGFKVRQKFGEIFYFFGPNEIYDISRGLPDQQGAAGGITNSFRRLMSFGIWTALPGDALLQLAVLP
jgi:hypothetical protein